MLNKTFSFAQRWTEMHKKTQGIDAETAEMLEQRDRDLEDFLSGIETGGLSGEALFVGPVYGGSIDYEDTWNAGYTFWDTTYETELNTPPDFGLYLVIARMAAAGTGTLNLHVASGWSTSTSTDLILDDKVKATTASAFQPAGPNDVVYPAFQISVEAHTDVEIIPAGADQGYVHLEYSAYLLRSLPTPSLGGEG